MSHLLISPDAPFAIRAATTAVLALHVSAGCTGIASGFASVLLKKGGRGHRVAGTVFFVSMLTMSAIGAVVSPMLADPVSSAMGGFTFYMVATAWMTVQRPAGRVGRFEMGGPGRCARRGGGPPSAILGRIGTG